MVKVAALDIGWLYSPYSSVALSICSAEMESQLASDIAERDVKAEEATGVPRSPCSLQY